MDVKKLLNFFLGLSSCLVEVTSEYKVFSSTTLQSCEHTGSDLYLSCSRTCGTIFITHGYWGANHNPCDAPLSGCNRDVTTDAGSKCNGHQLCSLVPSNAVTSQGDPCPTKPKYLKITYECRGSMPDHCTTAECDSRLQIKCTKCENNFEVANGVCERMCSSENEWCWPGLCGNHLKHNCRCFKGFTETPTNSAICQPTSKPEIQSCQVRAYDANNTYALSYMGSNVCSLQNNFYGRFQVDHFTIDLFAVYVVTLDENHKNNRPKFVSEEEFGVTDVTVHIYKESSERSSRVGTTYVKTDSTNNPESHFNRMVTIPTKQSLNNGERLCLDIIVQAGGYLVSNNYHTHKNVSYKKNSTNKTLCYIYDPKPPRHCSVTGTCKYKVEPLELSSRLTASNKMSVNFNGWVDPSPSGQSVPSGIKEYEISVYQVVESTPKVLMRSSTMVGKSYKLNNSFTSLDFELPRKKNPILYAILLEVTDFAKNVQQARRFVLYDDSSTVEINKLQKFEVETAKYNTGSLWQINHDKICFSWKNRFYNTHYRTNNPMRKIAEDSNSRIIGDYDQTSGVLPISGTKNIRGLTQFNFTLKRNGKNITSGQVDNITSERLCVNPVIVDGDIFSLFLEVRDIMNHTVMDMVTLNIDQSVPEIADIWLTRDEEKKLYVHHSNELSKIVIQFKAFDLHSGLHMVKWAFGIYENRSILIEGTEAVDEKIENKNDSTIYCPKIGNCTSLLFHANLTKLLDTGDHNRRYFVSIEVMNNAFLSSFDNLDILVDDSPPAVGVVLEGPVGTQDIDYTSDDSITIHWHDFIDHESGIKQFKVALGNKCLNEAELFDTGLQNGTIIFETLQTSTKVQFPGGEGQYFASVVAYNNAMSPSKVVCSDGIIFDMTFPTVSNLALKHGKIKESIGCLNGIAWLIKENLIKVALNSSLCTNLCKGKSDDVILKIIPSEIVTNTNTSDISEFICGKVMLYSSHVIYVPSDLLDLSWETFEDRSQISDTYIGFGKDRSTIDDPDILGYIKVHDPSRYIQHHPGLLGEDTFYIFLRVINRAGLETTVWLGPVLADETPPVCPTSLQPVVKGNKLVIEWTHKDVFDTEQSEEIGQVMFRFGIRNSFITPFLEWNLENRGDCRAKNQCIKYPVERLQKYNSKDGSEFYAQLHFYNYAGHYCSITSLPFHMPSLFPPGAGLVLDVLPNSEHTYYDVDYIIDSNQFCVAWMGFDHHENIQLQLGLGTSPEVDDSIPFHSIPSNMTNLVCEDFRFKTKRYYTTIKASCSGGTTLSSSDGFVVLDEASVLTSLSVYHGEQCNNPVEFELINKQSNIEIQTRKPLMFGRTFSIFTPANITLNDPNILAMESRMLSGFYVFTFMSLNDIEILNITSAKKTANNLNKTNTYLYQCNPLQKTKISETFIPVHWTLDSNFSENIIHYKTALCTYIDGTCQNDLVYQHAGRSTSYNFTGNFASSSYKVFVKPCFGPICLSSVSSETFMVEYKPISPISFSAKATVHGLRLNVSLTIEKYLCYMNESAPVYRWAVYTDGDGFRQVSDLKYVVDEPVKMQGVSWIDTNILPYKISFVCVEPVCSTGIMPKHCSPIEFISDPNTFEKNIIYDLNLNDIFTKDLLKFRYTANVGSKLRLLQDSELEFTDPNVKIGGLIIGRPTMKITWYLTSKRDVPSSLCSIDDSCLHSLNTTGGFVDFNNPFMKTDQIFYICAASSEFRLCSNGFLVDSSYPHAGIVSIDTFNGYVIDDSHLAITWKGFTGNKDALKLGYLSDIAGYQYAVGTSKGTDDVLPFTSVGLSEAVTIEGLHLKPGRAYYASVRAFNHMNHTVDAVSNYVIYDPSPPSTGVIEVEDSFYGYVAAKTLSLRWFGIEDRESGINMIEIGIGSHNNSADVLPFRKYIDAATIYTDGVIYDGHTYYAILRATNGAGHQSYTVSLPVIIDSSPPSVGHVMETSQGENIKKDIDYQTDSNSVSISWFGFYDPHSKLSFYKVALGTTPGDDDIFPYTNIGLKTSTTWKFDFTHGVRYYTSVMACNGAELCSIATSNGVIIDTSPPVPGLVVVGDPGRHSRYQSNRKTVHATWVGFQDPHSGLDHFEVCVGTSELSCDVANPTDVQMTSSILKSDLNMTVGVPHYVTIIACNKVKMCVKRSSKKFTIDQTPPNVLKNPYLDNVHMEKYNGRYVISDPSFIKVMWKYNDDESPIVRTSISVISEIGSHIPLDDVIVSAVSEYTIHLLRNESLRQGDVYMIKVTACNAADLCTTSVSDEILVDSSPPQIGGFKPPMWYKLINESIIFHISWYGFFDSQSGIRSYHLSIGSGYSDRGVVDNLMVLPNGIDDTESVEVTALNQDLQDFVILSLWAVNNAGLATLETKVTVDVTPTASDLSHGSLIIQMHSCAMYFCSDKCTLCECTCGTIGKKCLPRKDDLCTKTSTTEQNHLLSVNVSMRTVGTTQMISTSSTCLAANWTCVPTSSSILRYEYSFGRNGSDIGEGIYNLSFESQWHDVGSRQNAFHCLYSGELSHGTYYVGYVRAWVSHETYVTATSLPLLIDHTPPVIHKHHPVTDSFVPCGEDVDYITSNSTIYGCWNGVFSDDESGIINYIVSLGTAPGVDDIVSMTNIGVTSHIIWPGMDIEPGTIYYTNVIAVNAIGLQTGVSSDGFLLDGKAPKEGAIFNTKHHSNRIYQSLEEQVFFSWHGFDDEHSSIQSYMIAFELNNYATNRNKSIKFMETGNSNHFLYPEQLLHGDSLTAHIKAIDAAGHESLIVTSQSLLIDGTSPRSFECANFDIIKQTYYNISHSHHVISELTSSKQNDVLKIKVKVDEVELGFVTYLSINDMTMLMPFATNADESVASEYNYLVDESGVMNISLQFYEVKRGASAYVEISACSNMRTDETVQDAIMVQQMSQNEISVCIQAIDVESGIRRISIGVGSIPDGTEILAMRTVPLHRHDVIKGNFTHGMTIFVTSKVENHAGMTSNFKSKPLILDMTPPIIASGHMSATYVPLQNDTLTIIIAHWAVQDHESEIRLCLFCVGSSLESCDIAERTKTRTLKDLRSNPVQLPHGSKIYVTVQCVNSIELTGTAHFGPLMVLYLPPVSTESHVNVIGERTTKSCADGGSQSDSITFTWDSFRDISGINTYSVGYYLLDTKTVEWTNISNKNYLRLHNLRVHDKEQYTLFVRAKNSGGLTSETINGTANVDCRIPLLTGSKIEIRRVRNNDYNLAWGEVFRKESPVISYEVSVGSDEEYTDILLPTSIEFTFLEFVLPENVNEIYVVLTAYTPTGQSLTYRQSIIINYEATLK